LHIWLNIYKKLNIMVVSVYANKLAYKSLNPKGEDIMGGFLNLYQDTSKALRAFFSQLGIFKILLPLDVVFIILGFGIPLLTGFFGILTGVFAGTTTILGALAVYFLVLGILLAMANGHSQFVFIGLFAMAGTKLLIFIKYLVKKGWPFNWEALLSAIIIGGIAYLIMQYCSGVSAED
jgi:hypothetical protein